jgi:hypothetical protein
MQGTVVVIGVVSIKMLVKIVLFFSVVPALQSINLISKNEIQHSQKSCTRKHNNWSAPMCYTFRVISVRIDTE